MPITPNLQRKLRQVLGPDAAGDLGAWMRTMDAHRTDIGELRREMQLGFAKMDERFAKIDERFARGPPTVDVPSRMYKSVRRHTWAF